MHPRQLIILDEPTNGLDPESLAVIKEIITQLKNKQRIILMNCHDLVTVEQVCTNIAILQNGRCIYASSQMKSPLSETYLKMTKEYKKNEE